MTNIIELDNAKSYATRANLEKALTKLGLDDYTNGEGQSPCRYIVCQNGEGRWTAIFLVSQFFSMNKTGGYVGFASQHGFTSI